MSHADPLRIASRGSQLALWQANRVCDLLRAGAPGSAVRIEVVRTTGDRITDVPLARIGDRGLFTKEIDDVLLAGGADLAVHSLKDVPTRIPAGLALAAVMERADPRDVLICRDGIPGSLESLPRGARVGTSSLRRRAQLLSFRRDLDVLDLRGNLDTRLSRLDTGRYEAILLAAAGVQRLGWEHRISQRLPADRWLPAVGQGALALITRADDPATRARLRPLHDEATDACVRAERAFLRRLEGGCQVPIGALARHEQGRLSLDGFVASLDGERLLRETQAGPPHEPEELGTSLAEQLVARGADDILAEIRRASDAPGIPAP